MNKLILAYEEYIHFLEGIIKEDAKFKFVHGIQYADEEIKMGEELRKKIQINMRYLKLKNLRKINFKN